MNIYNRVKQVTTTAGTGTYTIGTTVDGFLAFVDEVADGEEICYCVQSSTAFELGLGIFTASGTTLTRGTILHSSNSGAPVDWAAGDKDIFITALSEHLPIMGTGDPATNLNPSWVGQQYINTTAGKLWICRDISTDANVWEEQGAVAFSTSEVKTQEKWIDGKPIYTKTIDFGALPNNTNKALAHGAASMDTYWIDFSNSFAVDTVSQSVSHPHPTASWRAYLTTTNINITTTSDKSAASAYITIRYTKTTD